MHYSYIRFINLLTHDESPENESLTKYRKRANSDDAQVVEEVILHATARDPGFPRHRRRYNPAR